MSKRRASLRIPLALATALLVSITAAAPVTYAQSVNTFASGISDPRSLAFDTAGHLYLSQRYSVGRIVKFTPPANTYTLFAAGMVDPIDMVFDDSGNMFVADYDNEGTSGRIWKITSGGVRSSFVAIANPGPLTRDTAGNLYVGEYFNQKIDKVTPAGVVSTYVAAIGASGARLTMLYMDTDGTLYAGMLSGTIYKVGPGGSPVTTFNSSMGSCVGFTRGPDGNWYASSYDNEEIWQITPAGVATLYAGAHNSAGLVNGPLLSARFRYAAGLVSGAGMFYVADYGNAAVRSVDFPTATQNDSWGRIKTLYR